MVSVVDLYDFDDAASLQNENDVLNVGTVLGVSDWANISTAHTVTIAGVGKTDTASGWSQAETAFTGISDGLTSTEVANDYTVVQAYQTALSRQV